MRCCPRRRKCKLCQVLKKEEAETIYYQIQAWASHARRRRWAPCGEHHTAAAAAGGESGSTMRAAALPPFLPPSATSFESSELVLHVLLDLNLLLGIGCRRLLLGISILVLLILALLPSLRLSLGSLQRTKTDIS